MQTKQNFFSAFSEKLYFGIEQIQHLRCISNENLHENQMKPTVRKRKKCVSVGV